MDSNAHILREALIEVLRYVPAGARRRAVIAGGFAACPDRAADVDLWILADENGEFPQHKLYHSLKRSGTGVGLFSYDNGTRDRKLVTCFERAFDSRELQILVTTHTTAEELVASFDISTHKVAARLRPRPMWRFWEPREVEIIRGSEWTDVDRVPEVKQWLTPKHTLERLHKIAARFGHKPNPEDVQRLTDLVEAQSVVEGLAA